MKFKQVTPKEPWTREQTQARIDFVESEIVEFNREMNDIDSKISGLSDLKNMIRRKVSNKRKYINQLEGQLKEQLNSEQTPDECDATKAK